MHELMQMTKLDLAQLKKACERTGGKKVTSDE